MKLVKPILNSERIKNLTVLTYNPVLAMTTNWNVCHMPYLFQAKPVIFPKIIEMGPSTKNNTEPTRTGATCQDYAKTKCYNYKQLKHLSKDCLAL